MKIVKIVKCQNKPEPVYDLSVTGTENFCLANGCVVHNSKDIADALAGVVYGLTTRREIWIQHGITLGRIPKSITDTLNDKNQKRLAAS